MKIKKDVELNLLKSLESTFDGCYSCTRVWSAWSYDTMGLDDFIAFDRSDDLFSENLEYIKNNFVKNENIKDEESFANEIMNLFDSITLYYNENPDKNFNANSFNDDIFDIVDLKDLYNSFEDYRNTINLKEDLIKKLESTFDCCYTCSYHWSGWDNGSLSREDFKLFDREHDLFNDLYTKITEDLLFKDSIKDNNHLYYEISNIIYDYDLYKNENLRDSFEKEYFKNEVWNDMNTRSLSEAFFKYKEALEISSPVKVRKIKPF